MRIQLGDIHTEYSVHGDQGPWLILSNSLGCTQAMWEPQLQALSRNHRVLCYDSRGHGNTDAPDGDYDLDTLANDALRLLDHVGIERVIWVGFSMGGRIGQTFALKHPKRVAAIVLADTTSAHTATPAAMWAERIRVAREGGMAPLVEPAVTRWFSSAFRKNHPDKVRSIANMIASTHVNGWAGSCAAISTIHTTERLHEIQCPALVIVGELDVGTPLSGALDMHRRLSDSVLVVISDAAHMSNIEQPAQFNRALLMFLNVL